MMDRITETERALIDDAVAAGRVVVVPPGTQWHQGYRWDGEQNRMVARCPERSGTLPTRRGNYKRNPKTAERHRQVAEAFNSDWTVERMAREFGVTEARIRNDLYLLGLKLSERRGSAPPRTEVRGKPSGDRAGNRKHRAAQKKAAAVRDRRRFKVTPVATGNPSRLYDPDAKGTKFPGKVLDPDGSEAVLKDGANNSKIGGDVLVGWLRGAHIVTLTLEERATCPKSCGLWQACYGNAMPHSRRWRHGDALLERLKVEIADLCAGHETVLVRLHVLGDFWSLAYVLFWQEMLERHANLFVFGFTAHGRKSEIGALIAEVRSWHEKEGRQRFFIRHSETTGPWGAFTIDFPTDRLRIGDAVVCPEQRDGMEGSPKRMHCGACGLCWKSDVPIVFVMH